MIALTQNIIKPQQALQSYLDDLLQEAFVDLAQEDLDAFAQAVREEQLRDAQWREVPAQPVQPSQALNPVSAPPLVVDSSTVAPRLADAPVVANAPLLVESQPSSRVQIDQRPEWAHEPFECLLFDVAGLTLAVPLISLGTIHPLDSSQVTPLFGQPNWFLGLLPVAGGQLRVLDTARWVLAERYRDDFREGLQYVISVQGCEWGLAVHQVRHAIRLDPQAVKWRTQRSQRPWLAGTVIEHMCALLDVTVLAELIVAGGISAESRV